jgi:uncharacterized C2H2 Zn-finger protein
MSRDINKKEEYRCKECGMRFRTKIAFTDHVKSHKLYKMER